MRARYYEPSTGRFVSEDPQMNGLNPYLYASNHPTIGRDSSGKSTEYSNQAAWVGLIFGLGGLLYGALASHASLGIVIGSLAFLAFWYGIAEPDAYRRGLLDTSLEVRWANTATGILAAGMMQIIGAILTHELLMIVGDIGPTNILGGCVAAWIGFISIFMTMESMVE